MPPKRGASVNEVGDFLDSDDSEEQRRRRRHRKMPDPLKKLLKKEIPNLLTYLQRDLPRSAHIFAFIKLILKWKESVEMKSDGIKYKILVAREECGAECPLIIACYTWKGEVRGSIYAPSNFGVQALKDTIKYSKFWPIGVEGGSCEWAVYPAEAAAEFLSVKHEGDTRYTSYPVHLFWMSPEELRFVNFEIPREFKTNPLDVGYVYTINHYWGRHRSGSEDLVRQMILKNPSAAASTLNDELAGWALQTHYGALGIVHTVQKHRRKGIARSLLATLARSLNDEGSVAHVFTHRDDQDTKTFLTKSGFTFVSEYFYFYIDPPVQARLNFQDK